MAKTDNILNNYVDSVLKPVKIHFGNDGYINIFEFNTAVELMMLQMLEREGYDVDKEMIPDEARKAMDDSIKMLVKKYRLKKVK